MKDVPHGIKAEDAESILKERDELRRMLSEVCERITRKPVVIADNTEAVEEVERKARYHRFYLREIVGLEAWWEAEGPRWRHEREIRELDRRIEDLAEKKRELERNGPGGSR